nr:post-transcriptional regulator [Enterococcus quebecensis]
MLKKELKIKCHSFRQLGYSSVNETELMNYLVSYRWKKNAPSSVKACREDILHIEPNDFFDYQQLIAQTSNLKISDWQDLKDLF